MLPNQCSQFPAHFNAAKLTSATYKNVTGQVEKHFSSPAKPSTRKKQSPETRFVSQQRTIAVMAAIFMTVLLHPTRAELITAALSRGCHRASEENVNQRRKHKQTKENAGLQHCIATREREGGFCFPGSTLDHSGVQKREGGGEKNPRFLQRVSF